MKKQRHYYVSGHTRIGYYCVLPEIAKKLDCLFIVKGLSASKTNAFLVSVADHFKKEGKGIDFLHSPNNNDHIEGIILRKSRVAIIGTDLAASLEDTLDEYRVVFLNFNKVYHQSLFRRYSYLIHQLKNERKFHIQRAYQLFAEAKHHHQRKEDIYIEWMDFKKADAVCEKLAKNLFKDREETGVQGNLEEIFFGAATPKGAVHFIDELTEGLKARFIIKGRSGSGKSTLMKRIGERARNLGMNVTYFKCGFDPGSYDMIIIDKLKIAIIDGTAPHVINPTRENDQVIDMFELCINQEVEEKHIDAIRECESTYKELMKRGTKHLEKAAEIQQVIDEYYDAALDKLQMEELEEKSIAKIIHVLQ